MNQDQLWRLFDIIPGLDFCQITGECSRTSNYATAVYNNAEAAAYARDKLHGLEYPPGERLIIKQQIEIKTEPLNSGPGAGPNTGCHPQSLGGVGGGGAGGGGGGGMGTIMSGGGSNSMHSNEQFAFDGQPVKDLFSSVSLPDPAPIADAGAMCAKRCFIVCVPKALPVKVLQNVFSRFGGLIDVYMLQNKNCGYAKYASEESAQAAIDCLHRADICGVKLKVRIR